MKPREAAHATMREVSGALIAIGLVLVAVFIPARSCPASLASSTASSRSRLRRDIDIASRLPDALRPLSPPSCSSRTIRSKLRAVGASAPFHGGCDRFTRLSNACRTLWASHSPLVRTTAIMLVFYAGLVGLTGWQLTSTPTASSRNRIGYLIGVVQCRLALPRPHRRHTYSGARTSTSTPGVAGSAVFAGLDGASFSRPRTRERCSFS